jgi:hypothetical protein
MICRAAAQQEEGSDELQLATTQQLYFQPVPYDICIGWNIHRSVRA